MKDCRRDPYAVHLAQAVRTDEASGDARALAQQERLPELVSVSENVAKLIAILATFSRTGHN